MSAKHRITVTLDDAEYEALQCIADASERSLAWLSRKAICDFLERKERAETPLLAGLVKTDTGARRPVQ